LQPYSLSARINTMLRSIITITIASLLSVAVNAAPRPAPATTACYAGAYELSDGTQLVITPSDDEHIRYRLPDGRSGKLGTKGARQFHAVPGWSEREPPPVHVTFSNCPAGTLTWQWGSAAQLSGKRMPQRVIPARFASGDVQLYGELHLPAHERPRAVIVLQFGGGRTSAVVENYVQHLLPLKNLAVFVFDKRGTGQSSGDFTIHFGTLSDDLVAAVRQVRSMPQVADIPLGLMGESQGGWVVPLAANKTAVDFTIVSYGLAVSIREENRLETLYGLNERGYGPEIQARAGEVLAVADRIMRSRFREGLDELRHLREAYGSEKWYQDLSAEEMTGDYTSALANASDEQLAEVKAFFNIPYELDYDPIPALRKVTVPSLWVLAGKDTEAPSASTIEIIRKLQSDGKPIDLAVFPNADHGMIEVERTAQGPKELERHSPGYFDLLAHWAAHRSFGDKHFGPAQLTPRRR
jgi:uncharacterized protein